MRIRQCKRSVPHAEVYKTMRTEIGSRSADGAVPIYIAFAVSGGVVAYFREHAVYINRTNLCRLRESHDDMKSARRDSKVAGSSLVLRPIR